MSNGETGMSPDARDLAMVARSVRAAGSSFYWAMRLMDRERRAGLYAIYDFCRAVDDIADGPLPPQERKAALAAWRRRIDRLYAEGRAAAEDARDRLILAAIDRYGLVREDFLAVIDGMEMDADGPIRAPDPATLDLYCDRVASAVGRLCVRVFGAPMEEGRRLAHHQGRALQLTNIIRDVEEDAAMGRLYLPAPLLEDAGIDGHDPLEVARHPRLVEVRHALGAVAEREFAEARAALASCSSGDMRPARIMMAVYEDIFRAMKARDFTPSREGPLARRLAKLGKIMTALAIAIGRRR
ncbi:MAG: presqualene diphosphate synthase HpnD [Rhodothalassiaceae bacterium]